MLGSQGFARLFSQKSWKSVLLWMALIAGAIALPPGLYLWYLSLEKVDAVFIPESEFETNQFCQLSAGVRDTMTNSGLQSRYPDYAVHLHRLRNGSGTFFAHRQFKRQVRDSQGQSDTYRKTSIWMLDPQVGLYQFKDNDKVKAYFSKGRAGDLLSGCGGQIHEGWLRILSVQENQIELELNAEVDCHRLEPQRENPCANPIQEKRHLVIRQSFRRLPMEKVTPWIGKVGTDQEDEVHRPLW